MNKYFVMDTFNSDYEEFESQDEALKHAEECIGDGSDGWAQELLDGAVKLGVITHESMAVNKRDTENKEWDFECECEMSEVDETFAIFAGECGVDVSGAFTEEDCKNLIKNKISNLEYDLEESEKEIKQFKFMIEKGIGWEDLKNDITINGEQAR